MLFNSSPLLTSTAQRRRVPALWSLSPLSKRLLSSWPRLLKGAQANLLDATASTLSASKLRSSLTPPPPLRPPGSGREDSRGRDPEAAVQTVIWEAEEDTLKKYKKWIFSKTSQQKKLRHISKVSWGHTEYLAWSECLWPKTNPTFAWGPVCPQSLNFVGKTIIYFFWH